MAYNSFGRKCQIMILVKTLLDLVRFFSNFVFLLEMANMKLFYKIIFFSKFKYSARRGTCGYAKNAKNWLNSAFEPKLNAVAEKIYLENQPPTYLGKAKKN